MNFSKQSLHVRHVNRLADCVHRFTNVCERCQSHQCPLLTLYSVCQTTSTHRWLVFSNVTSTAKDHTTTTITLSSQQRRAICTCKLEAGMAAILYSFVSFSHCIPPTRIDRIQCGSVQLSRCMTTVQTHICHTYTVTSVHM